MTKQVLVVTGGSTGIGAAVARMAAARGYAVDLSYRTGRARAQQVVADIRATGGQAMAVEADSADAAQTEAFFAEVDRALGPVTALVNNAGITGPVAKLDEITPTALDEVLAINVRGCFIALRQAILRMATDLGGAGGSVVNVSSRAAEIGGANDWVHYAASKGAVDSFTIGAAKELAARGIRVNAVNPGLIDTGIHAKAGMPDRVERLRPMIPMGRAGSADEVARVILWLLSDEASYVTGALVPVGGGPSSGRPIAGRSRRPTSASARRPLSFCLLRLLRLLRLGHAQTPSCRAASSFMISSAPPPIIITFTSR